MAGSYRPWAPSSRPSCFLQAVFLGPCLSNEEQMGSCEGGLPAPHGPQPGSSGRPRGRGCGRRADLATNCSPEGTLCLRNPRGWVQDLAHLGHLDLRAEVPGTICYFCFGDRLGGGENLPLFSSLRADPALLRAPIPAF